MIDNPISNKSPLVSIIVPVYNVEAYLSRCIDSILSQTYDNLEIILVDDGSQDHSSSICNLYASKNQRVKAIRKENGGVSSARNTGLNEASGEYIFFVDADDYLAHNAIEYLLDKAITTSSDIVCCMYKSFTEKTNPSMLEQVGQSGNHDTTYSTNQALSDILYQKKIANAPFAKLIHKKLLAIERFEVGISVAEDLNFNYRVFSNAKKITVIDSALYFYFQRSDSAMNKPFSNDRMDGLASVEDILLHTRKHKKKLIAPAQNRFFMEAIFILMQIGKNDQSAYYSEWNRCLNVIKCYRLSVLGDSKSSRAVRLVALMSCINVRLTIHLLRIRERAS